MRINVLGKNVVRVLAVVLALLGSTSIASLNNDSVQAASEKTTKRVKKSKAKRQQTTKGLFAVKAGINGTLNTYSKPTEHISRVTKLLPEAEYTVYQVAYRTNKANDSVSVWFRIGKNQWVLSTDTDRPYVNGKREKLIAEDYVSKTKDYCRKIGEVTYIYHSVYVNGKWINVQVAEIC